MSYLACDACGLSVRMRAPFLDVDRCPRCGEAAVVVPAPANARRRATVTPVRSTVVLRGPDRATSAPRMDPA